MKGFTNMSQRNQRGATTLELLFWSIGAIAIIGLAAIAFITYQGNQRVATTQAQIMELSGAIKGLYPDPNYNGVTPKQIVDAKKAPAGMASGTTLVSRFGSIVAIAPAAYNGGTDNAFQITYPGVPTSECNSLIGGLGQNFVELRVGTTVVKDATTPINSAAVTTACANPTNSLVFLGV